MAFYKTLSIDDGILNSLLFPLALGMYIRRTGFGLYLPSLTVIERFLIAFKETFIIGISSIPTDYLFFKIP